MTTLTSDQERAQRLEQLEAMTAREWATYGERLRDLEGAEYDTTESEAWDDLQRALDDLRDERVTLGAAAQDSPEDPS